MKLASRTRSLVVSLLAVACLDAPVLSAGSLKAGKPAKVTPLNDANIAAIVLAANTIDIDNANLALKTSNEASVKEFATMMATDHTSVNEKAKALAGKLKLAPVQNMTSRGLVKSMNAKREELAKLHGGDFDKAYMDNEVTYHQAVLDLMDQKLIPAAKNAELKDLLTGVRPAFEAHLAKAKETRAALKG
jgi:putative membrane protein